ncbi:hypothetical protein B0H11DRAFT_2332968 [Mycena galericulata]|nr:hypothetical protein B0H11DRAFT_2332968 [Mycena galericulata]
MPKTPGRKTSTLAQKPPKRGEVDVDESLWRESTISDDQTISKTLALRQYRISASHLAELKFTKDHTIITVFDKHADAMVDRMVPMILYSEREVERIAWRIRGGPEAFQIYLDERREKYAKTHPGKEFPEPDAYKRDNITGGVSIIQPSPWKAHVDPSASTPKLFKLKQRYIDLGRLWLWLAANKGIELRDDVRGRDKETALEHRSLTGPDAYPRRPALVAPDSFSYIQLRGVLSRAASDQDHLDSYEDHCEGETTWSWKKSYMEELFKALIAVIYEHGIEGVGWKSARWEVYDRHSSCIQPLSFFRRENKWYDDAKDWLQGRMTPYDGLMPRQDNISPWGKRYNEMLPIIPLGQ